MSGKTDNLNSSYSDRISELGERLDKYAGDEAMLAEIHAAIRLMLEENGDSESQIRQELQRCFDQEEIRPESFELVQKMLDRIALEKTTKLGQPIPDPSQRQETTVAGDPIATEAPLQKTVRLEAPHDQSVPVDQTVRIKAPFPEEQPPQESPPQDASPTDEVPVGDSFIDDEEFINTAVLNDQANSEKPADDQLQVGSVLRDRFLLQERLAGGSMGVIFKALDRRLAEAGEENPHVAIKVLSSKLSRNANALRALQQEAAKGRYLSHPNIVRFIDLDREDDMYFIVMEWLEGRSLAEILDDSTGKKVDLYMALNIVSQVSRALDYAHLRGVVHADVKPGNIVITPDGHAKLLDFGVARIRQKQLEGKSKFDPGVLGAASPAYSSMQVLTGEDPAPTDDVFSLACLLYRLIAGMRVFGPRNAADAAAEGMEPQRPTGLSDEQWRAIKKALSYSRVTRFASPKAFMDALAPGLRATGSIVNPKPAPAAAPPQAQAPAPAVAQVSAPATAVAPTPIAEAVPAPAPAVAPATPVMTATRDLSPDGTHVLDEDGRPRRSPWRLAVVGTILIASVAVVTQTELVDYLDRWRDSDLVRSITGVTGNNAAPVIVAEPNNNEAAVDDGIIDAPADEESLLPDIAETNTESEEEILVGDELPVADDAVIESETEVAAEVETEAEDGVLVADEYLEPEPELPAFDYSSFLPATISLAVFPGGDLVAESALSVRENTNPAIIELTRGENLVEGFSVVLQEVRFSGNRSPLDAGRYALENKGVVNFVPGQERAQTTISMSSNFQRESDQQVTLQIRQSGNSRVVLATINLTLEDDDQREFESGLLPNTVSFAVSQATVRESDPALQVDVIRYRPDNNSLDVEYRLSDVTATEGKDYFAPGFNYVSFGPGQRTARILIPLGQDAVSESDEAFMVELLSDTKPLSAEIVTRLAVMIRDDD